jgi:hypothetical protein
MQWSAGTRQVGALLLSVPLILERTPPSTAIAIPDALMDLRSVTGSSGQSAQFDAHRRTWHSPQLSASTTRLRWQLPSAVLPLKLDRATLTIDGNIPSRQLSVYAIRAGEKVAIAQRSSHAGRVQIDITEADLLTLDDQGGMAMEFEIGEIAKQLEQATVSNATWSIRSTMLDVWGQTLPADLKEAQ